MFLNLHPKCANPSCAVAFGWITGGKLFRFHREARKSNDVRGADQNSTRSHLLEHFWLCERCSNIYTLQYEQGQGVKIYSLWPQLPAADSSMHLPSS
jgi:hypothetical protein